MKNQKIILFILIFILKIELLFSQSKLYGNIYLCNNIPYEVSLYTSDNSCFLKGVKRNGTVTTKCLNATIKLIKKDSVFYETKTVSKNGDYQFNGVISQEYIIEVFVYKGISIRKQIEVKQESQKQDFCLDAKEYFDSLRTFYKAKIIYNSLKAKQDLEAGEVYLLRLHSYYDMIPQLPIEKEDIAKIEEKFGFKFLNQDYQAPKHSIAKELENQYNEVVYEYLDQKLGGNSRKLIKDEILFYLKKRFKKK